MIRKVRQIFFEVSLRYRMVKYQLSRDSNIGVNQTEAEMSPDLMAPLQMYLLTVTI